VVLDAGGAGVVYGQPGQAVLVVMVVDFGFGDDSGFGDDFGFRDDSCFGDGRGEVLVVMMVEVV